MRFTPQSGINRIGWVTVFKIILYINKFAYSILFIQAEAAC